jgi:autotransporter-associated beta strand protein
MNPKTNLRNLLAAAAITLIAAPGALLAASDNADLSNLAISSGTLDPAFDSSTTSYTVSPTVASITVTPTADNALATITVNGDPVVSGDPSNPVSLSVGPNTITIIVTAEDEATTKTYTLTVTPEFPALPGPVAYWPMRDGAPGQIVPTGTGNAAQNVINIANTFVNGTVNNTNSTWESDPLRGIVWSTTEGNRINAGTQGIDLATGFTWSLWVNADVANITDPGADCIIGTRQGGTWHKIDRTSITNWNGAVPSSGGYADLCRSEWIHIAYVGHSSFGRRLYVDGQLVASNATTTSATFNGALEIGGTSNFNEDITGLYSDVAIWNQALSLAQIESLIAGVNIIEDTTAPVIASLTPEDDDTNASSNLLRAIFDEPVIVGSGDIRIINLTDDVTTTLDVTDASQVTVSGASLTLNPSTALIVGKSYAIEIDAGAVTNVEGLDFAGILDQTTWNFTVDDTPPTIVSIVDSVGGGPIGEDIAFYSYTVTFNEPMDGSTVDDTVFDNAGAAIVSIGTVTQVSPAVFTVQVLPTSTGTVILRIPSGKTVTDVSGNALVVPVTDDTTITINVGDTPNNGIRYWDGNLTSGITDGISQGGNGTWNTTNTNWDRGLGFAGPVAWNNANNDIAILGGANGAATLAEPITVGGLQIDNKNIDIVSSTLTFGVAGEINSTDTSANQNDPPIISSKISGAAITKSGGGYISLTNNANDFTAFTLSAGTLGQLPGGTYTGIGTGLFTINGGGFFVTNNDQTTIDNDMVWNGNWKTENVSNAAKINEWNGDVTLDADITVSSKHAQVFNGDISETGGARKLTLTNSGGSSTITLAGDNSFSGGVQINQGRLNINSVTALGTGTFTINANGSVIDNTTANAITLSTNNAVTFGNNFTFEGTKDLTFGNGAITNAGSRTITLNGTGSTLAFGGVMTNTANAVQTTTVNGAGNTLVLGGYALSNNATSRINVIQGTGNVTITGAVSNGGTATASGLTKTGAGTLTLEGINTYAGNTTVNTGTLALVGGSQNSAITVNSAVLGFTLGSPTASSKAVTLNAGHSIAITGTVNNSSDYLLMTATGFTGTPTLSAAITDYELEVREVGDNKELWLAYTGTAGSPYDTWADTFLPDDVSNPAGDNDNDGLSNLLEFAFGTDPTVSDAGALTWDGVGNVVPGSPVVHIAYPIGGGVDFTARFMRRKDHGDSGSAAYAWRFSSDLSDWESSASDPAPGWFEAPTVLAEDAGGDYELVEVPYPFFLDANGKKARFFQVQISLVP